MAERRRGRAALAAVILAAVVAAASTLLAPPAAATAVSGARFRTLVEAADGGDGRALAELEAVTEIDGRPVDVRRVLGAGEERTDRLRALAGATGAAGPDGRPGAPSSAGAAGGTDTRPGPTTDAASARREARRILADRRYHPPDPPRPFRGILRTLGRWLRPVVEPVQRFFTETLDQPWTRLLLAAAAAAVTVAVAHRMARRRLRAAAGDALDRIVAAAGDRPEVLERAADDAERAGDLSLAYRLRFRAGVLRVTAAGTLAYRPSLTTGELRRRLGSATFDELAARFEEIAYGGRPAAPGDIEHARGGWPRVVAEARQGRA